ncbi:uncharacterized protein LJ206_010261 [Theristicus caerulescens]
MNNALHREPRPLCPALALLCAGGRPWALALTNTRAHSADEPVQMQLPLFTKHEGVVHSSGDKELWHSQTMQVSQSPTGRMRWTRVSNFSLSALGCSSCADVWGRYLYQKALRCCNHSLRQQFKAANLKTRLCSVAEVNEEFKDDSSFILEWVYLQWLIFENSNPEMFLSWVTTIELVVSAKNSYKGLSQRKGTASAFEHMQESHAKDGKKESLA